MIKRVEVEWNLPGFIAYTGDDEGLNALLICSKGKSPRRIGCGAVVGSLQVSVSAGNRAACRISCLAVYYGLGESGRGEQ